MTLYGWDASHYDGTLSRDILARAKAEGIAFFHHKVAEGLGDTETIGGVHYDDTALAAARDVGIEFVGAYFVPRTLDSAAQVAYWKRELDEGEPWLYDFPGRYAVIDLERWSYDAVAASKGIDCAKRLCDTLQWQTLLYASHGQYGDSLTAWDGPLINADYVARTAAGFAAMYPGDSWAPTHGSGTSAWRGGWAPYSGKAPDFLQYTSSATVAGLTTCDVNAYRGGLNDLRVLITRKKDPLMALSDQDAADLVAFAKNASEKADQCERILTAFCAAFLPADKLAELQAAGVFVQTDPIDLPHPWDSRLTQLPNPGTALLKAFEAAKPATPVGTLHVTGDLTVGQS